MHVFQLSSLALTRVRVGLRRRPSRFPLNRDLSSHLFAQVLFHVRVILPIHGQLHHKIDEIMIRVRPTSPLGMSPGSAPKCWEECYLLAKGEAQ